MDANQQLITSHPFLPSSASFSSYDISLVDGYNVGLKIEARNGTKISGDSSKYNCGSPECGTPTQPFTAASCPMELRTKVGGYCLSVCQAVVQQNTEDTAYLNGFNQALVCCECDCGPNCGCDDGTNAACKYGCSPLHPTNPPFNYAWQGVCDSSQWPQSSLGISYPEVFKKPCPDAYSWQFDDHNSTYQCHRPNYKLTFY